MKISIVSAMVCLRHSLVTPVCHRLTKLQNCGQLSYRTPFKGHLPLDLKGNKHNWALKISPIRRRETKTKAQLNLPLIPPTNHWGTWSALLAAGAFGIWSEKTKWGSALSGALVSALVGLAASNLGVVASEAPAYATVNTYLLPLAVPLLLYTADLRRVLASTGSLLIAFHLGSVATIIGTLIAYLLVPMRSLGEDSWKIAAALMSRHIGGALNYVAVSKALNMSPSVVASGLAADNLICVIYFTSLFALASRIPPEILSVAEGLFCSCWGKWKYC